MNAILIKGDAVGTTLYYGPGAGAEPTASAVIADLVDVTRLHTADPENHVPHLAFQPDGVARCLGCVDDTHVVHFACASRSPRCARGITRNWATADLNRRAVSARAVRG